MKQTVSSDNGSHRRYLYDSVEQKTHSVTPNAYAKGRVRYCVSLALGARQVVRVESAVKTT